MRVRSSAATIREALERYGPDAKLVVPVEPGVLRCRAIPEKRCHARERVSGRGGNRMIVTDPRVLGFHVAHGRLEVDLCGPPLEPAGMAVVGARRAPWPKFSPYSSPA